MMSSLEPAPQIRPAEPADFDDFLSVINEAADAYRGVIPADSWHDPYMSAGYLRGEIAAGVNFWVAAEAGHQVGVMGIQDVKDVTLIRHAYVRPARQRSGIGGRLLRHMLAATARPRLVGTWAAAHWAIAFYEKHGFELVTPAEKNRLLRKYWDIPERQVETSVVLADQRARQSGLVS